jgi:hypothetical protein
MRNTGRKRARRARNKTSWREFRDKLQGNTAELSDASKVATHAGFTRLHNLSWWLHKKTGAEYPAAVRHWRLLEAAFSKDIAEAYRDGMKALWRVYGPEKPVRQPGGPITVKWITICAYAAVGLECADNPDCTRVWSDSDVRRALQHACFSEQGYPDWLDTLIEARPKLAEPFVRDAFKAEWEAQENRVSYFIYHFAQHGVAIHPDLQTAVFDVIVSEPKLINTLDYALDIVRKLTLSEAQRATLRTISLARFEALKKSASSWAARYVALLFLLDAPSAVTTLIGWLRGEKPSTRKALTITVLGLLFGTLNPLIAGVLAKLPVPVLRDLTLFTYQEIRPDQDNVHEGSYTPDDRDDAENARNAILKALIESEGPAAFEAVMGLSRHPDIRSRRIRFRELARSMAERDADVSAWRPEDVLVFEREKTLPARTAPQLYRLVQAMINEIGWEFDNADASARAVLETAKDEEAVQEWLAAEMKQRAKGRYHVPRESEVAEGNRPDILVLAIGAPVEVAIEAKHGGKGWSTKAIEDSLRRQLVEDYLRPATRRHGVFVVTNHRTRGWRHPKTRKSMSFPEMIAYLNSVAVKLTKNSVREIAVAVIGIDAVRKPRTRTLAKRKKASTTKEAVARKKKAGRARRPDRATSGTKVDRRRA